MRDRDISEPEQLLNKKLLTLQHQDIKGSYLSSKLMSTVPTPLSIPDRFQWSHKSVCVLNHNYVQDTDDANHVPGISQESNHFGSNNDKSFEGLIVEDGFDYNGDISKKGNAYQSLIWIFKEMTSHIDDTPEARMLIQKAKKMMTQISMDALKINKDKSSNNTFVVGNVVATRMSNCKKQKVFHSKNY